MLFQGGKYTTQRLVVSAGGVVDHRVAGFAYTSADELVTETVADPQEWIKGIGIRSTGAVCTTTTTDASDVWIEGVRVTTGGKVVVASSAPTGTTSGNPVTATGALAITP